VNRGADAISWTLFASCTVPLITVALRLLRRPLITDHDCYYYMNMSSGNCSVKMGPAATLAAKHLGCCLSSGAEGFTGRSPRTASSAARTWRSREGGRTSRPFCGGPRDRKG